MKFLLGLILIMLFYSCVSESSADDWYKVEFESLCDKKNKHELNHKDVLKHGRNTPYEMEIKDLGESKSVSFKFIAACCLTFTGSASQTEDSLKLLFWNTLEANPCDCICDYKMIYTIDSSQNKWKNISAEMLRKGD